VITELTIGVDGLARDPEILLAVPETGFPAAVIEAWLNSRFVPASRDGVPIESRLQAQSLLAVEGGGGLSGWDVYRSARQRADAGDPGAGYLVGLTATLDASLGISPRGPESCCSAQRVTAIPAPSTGWGASCAPRPCATARRTARSGCGTLPTAAAPRHSCCWQRIC